MYRYIGTRKLIIYRNVSKLNYLIKTTLSCYFYITITFNLQKCITIIFAISNLTYASHELLEVALLTSSLTNSATSLPLPLPYFKAARGKEIENEMIPSHSCKWIVVQAHMRFTVINKRSYSFHVCVPFSRENAVSRLQNYRKPISLVRAKMAAIVEKVRVEDAPYARHSRQHVVVMTRSRAFQVLPSAIFRIFYV